MGLILVDEIQNAVLTARKNRQVKPLIKFLVELTNDTGTATYFVGTPEAEELFISQEHLKRRTRGIRLLPVGTEEGEVKTSTSWGDSNRDQHPETAKSGKMDSTMLH